MKQIALALSLVALGFTAAPASALTINTLIPTLTFPAEPDANATRLDGSSDDLRGQLLTVEPKK